MELQLVPDWSEQAQCRGTDQVVFFPSQEYYEGSPKWTELVSIAKSICRLCPVRIECLNYALESKQIEGIWGGLTPRERKRQRKHDTVAG